MNLRIYGALLHLERVLRRSREQVRALAAAEVQDDAWEQQLHEVAVRADVEVEQALAEIDKVRGTQGES